MFKPIVLYFYFLFSLSSRLVPSGVPIEVHLSYDLHNCDETQFLVRPVLSGGKVEIYNYSEDVWVSDNARWSDLPQLKNTLKIRVIKTADEGSELYFQLINSTYQRQYETPRVKVWNTDLLHQYISALNETLLDDTISR